jgi:ABC-type uncharacterized transport system substrate-binding protein
MYRIGLLSPESPPPGLLEEFREELRKRGYVEGKNVALDVRHAKGKTERLPALADELVQRRVDVITGVSFMLEELSVKRLQLLKEIIPSISRVALLWYTGNLGGAEIAKELEVASTQMGLQLLRLPVRGPDDFPSALEAAIRGRAEAPLLVDDAVITRYRGPLLSLAAKHRLPVTSQYRAVAEAGGLIAYGPSTPSMYRRAAQYVDTPELIAKRVQLLKEIAPTASRFAVLRLPGRVHDLVVRDMAVAARQLGVQLQVIEVRQAEDLSAAFDAAGGGRAEAVMSTQAVLPSKQRQDRAARAQAPAAESLRRAERPRGRRALVLRPPYHRRLSASGKVCRSDPEGRKAGRPPCRAADQVRACHQSQDREGARPHGPAVVAREGRQADSVIGTEDIVT